MKTSLFFTLILFTLSLFILLPHVAFAQEQQDERPIVRLIYFLPSDRAPQPDFDAKMDTLIKDVQVLFGNQMAAHGFDRKTFLYETDARGKAVVHRVIGRFTDEYYNNLSYTGDVWSEINEQFDTSKDIYLTAIDISTERLDTGGVCGRGGGWHGTGSVLVPASGDCFSVFVIAHELGHAFGLFHGWYGRDIENKQIWLYSEDEMLNTFWAADWFDVHVAFNPPRAAVLNAPPRVEMLPASLAAPPNTIRLRFEITGSNGHLHQAQLMKTRDVVNDPVWFLAGQRLDATPESIVEFVTSELKPEDRAVFLQMIDTHGNMTKTHGFPIDITPLLPAVSDFSPTRTLGKGSVSDIAYSPDGQRFAVAGGIGISLYDAATQRPLDLLTDTAMPPWCVAFSPNAEFLASGYADGTTHLWDVHSGEIRDTVTRDTVVQDVVFSPDGQLLAIAGSDGSIRLWYIHSGAIRKTLKRRTVNVNSVAFSPDSQTLASGVRMPLSVYGMSTPVKSCTHSLGTRTRLIALRFRLMARRWQVGG